MVHNPVIAAILGIIGTILWCIQLIPQIIINYLRHNTAGLQPFMLLLWSVGGIFMGIYNISRNLNIPLQLQPHLFLVLCFITWGQCLYYENKWSIYKCIIVFSFSGGVAALIETISILSIYKLMYRGINWPIETIGIISSILVCIGLLPPYYDIYIHKAVRGISFIFLLIDIGGAVFSFLSLFFEPKFDVLAAISYCSVVVLELGIIFCDYYFKILEWNKKRIWKQKLNQDASNKTPYLTLKIIDMETLTS
ncbi:hypothetical protein PCANB_003092 [Pneumocystis canis]|nr:hypothetical protein PCK1_003035 [Pneumocystis canis]KAG5438241.1 hypothetical protein PCANB_003092 [Pneumocystis canis]